MALVSKAIMLDITPGAIPKVVNVSEYDENRQFTVNLIDEGGVFEIPSGTTAKVEGTIGGSGFSANATISGNTITFTLAENMTAKAGDVWCKIKLTKDSKPIQTAAFILRCDRAGVEADAVIGAPGFEEQINQGIAEYFDNDPPFFELPSGGQSGQALVSDENGDAEWGGVPFQLPSGGEAGQALISDGADGAVWGQAQGGGSGLTEEIKQALLNCFRHVAWVDSNGQDYYDALYNEFYPEGFPTDFQRVDYIEATGTQYINLGITSANPFSIKMLVSWNDVTTRQLHGANGGFYFGVVNGKYQVSQNATTTTDISVNANEFKTIEFSQEVSGGEVALFVSGQKVYSTTKLMSSNNNTTLFALSGSDYKCKCKLKSAEVTIGNRHLVLVPCYRKANGEVGLMDTETNTFYANAGSGTFGKGADVNAV